MRLVIGSDHDGFQLKEATGDLLRSLGHEVLDVGAFNENPSDYPDFAEAVGRAVLDGKAERGVLICGSGVGASVAANKLPGIRAGMCHDTYSAHQGVEHDDINVLVLGSRVIGVKLDRKSTRLNSSHLVISYAVFCLKKKKKKKKNITRKRNINRLTV